jgi:YesN/AraC family two-component response regulator
VQKAILTIDEDLSSPLSTKALAEQLGVSLGYLSSIFKSATGQTVTDYILTRRMEYAEYLLSTSRLQVQTIATHCGIIDTQYFSKLFKKYKGVSPIQFRNKNIDKNN